MKIQEMNDKTIKKSPKKSNRNKKDTSKKSKKQVESSDSDSSSDDEDIDMDEHEYRKLLNSIFPSKYMNNKVKAGEKMKKAFTRLKKNKTRGEEDDEEDDEEVEEVEEVEEDDEEDDEEEIQKSKKKSKNIKSKTSDKKTTHTKKRNAPLPKNKNKGKFVPCDTESDEESSEYEEEDDEEDVPGKSGKFNLIFTFGGEDEEGDEDDEDSDEDWETEESWETEDEDEDVSSSSSEDDEEESDEQESCEDESEEEVELVRRNKSRKCKNNNSSKKSSPMKEVEDGEISEEHDSEENTKASSNSDFLEQLKKLYKQNKHNQDAKECIQACEKTLKKHEKKIKRKEKKRQEKNVRIFRKLVRDKNTNNDFEFFGKLQLEDQKKIIKELREVNTLIRVEKPYRLSLLESDMPPIFKGSAMKKINSLRYMEPGSGDYYKIKNWVDTFMRIPFGKYNNLPVNIDDGVDVCHEFMEKAKNSLDQAVYGLNDAKMQIMQMMGQLITNPSSIGTAIAIQGPMGTGKTTLVKEGISKILNRPFSFIALGGATDSSFLEGHSYTYEGSTWGKIVQILVDSKCMNPVIYFDELDKISDTPKGDEIAGILTHLTDTSQNSQFHDKYFAEVDFDLSKCLFIFSYNDETKINPILRDRMYRIHTKGYDKKQKSIIANDYLLPTIRDQVKFTKDDIVIPDDTLQYIMDNCCSKEDGVRNMKRCLEIIYTKLNLYRLMKPDTNLFEENMSLKVEFPFTVTVDMVNKLIKKEEQNMSYMAMYC